MQTFTNEIFPSCSNILLRFCSQNLNYTDLNSGMHVGSTAAYSMQAHGTSMANTYSRTLRQPYRLGLFPSPRLAVTGAPQDRVSLLRARGREEKYMA
jgi:hypothetical protein